MTLLTGLFSLQLWTGNSDRHSVVYHQFLRTFLATYVRMHPRTWYGWISMRVEFYGCEGKAGSHNVMHCGSVSLWIQPSPVGRLRFETARRETLVSAGCGSVPLTGKFGRN